MQLKHFTVFSKRRASEICCTS